MKNLYDYLECRGDISLDEDPFNEVDNVVLSELAYVSFGNIVPRDGKPVPAGEVREAFFAARPRGTIPEDGSHIVRAPLLLDSIAGGRRFGTAELTGYVDVVDTDEMVQMSAVTFLLGDGTAFVAFRGTDGTVVGWKENLSMSFLPATEGQRRAVEYMNMIGRMTERPLRAGGHSKGGNFAVFASAFCDRDIRDRITDIYTNDGPGFRAEVIRTEEYKSITGRVTNIVPDTSVTGMLLGSSVRPKYIKSSAYGIAQHDPTTWTVGKNRFMRSTPSDLGLFIMKSQKDWLNKLDDKDRAHFVDTLFTIIESTGMDTLDEMSINKLRASSEMLNSIRGMTRERQKEMNRIIGELLQSGTETARKVIGRKGK